MYRELQCISCAMTQSISLMKHVASQLIAGTTVPGALARCRLVPRAIDLEPSEAFAENPGSVVMNFL